LWRLNYTFTNAPLHFVIFLGPQHAQQRRRAMMTREAPL
jgi:hypothetical protein